MPLFSVVIAPLLSSTSGLVVVSGFGLIAVLITSGFVDLFSGLPNELVLMMAGFCAAAVGVGFRVDAGEGLRVRVLLVVCRDGGVFVRPNDGVGFGVVVVDITVFVAIGGLSTWPTVLVTGLTAIETGFDFA